MQHSRREFLQASIGAGLTAGAVMAAPQPTTTRASGRRLNLLILGGTSFIGPHIVDACLARGHTMTLFNRGKTNPQLFPELEKLKGDRDPTKGDGLKALAGRSFDGVIDTSGFFPRMVRASAELLADSVRHYVFISSISVYSDNSIPDMDESGPLATMEDPTLEEMGKGYQYYGALKALCEQAAEDTMPGRVANIRPGLIVGPRDNAPRFTYWPVRVERGGEVLSPGSPDDPVQYIDGRDLAEFVIKTLEDGTTGFFNATGPNSPTNIAELLYGCKAVTGGDARFTWVDAGFLEEQGVSPWSNLPVWVPAEGDFSGFHRSNIDKAIAAGLRSRPLAETVRDTLDWYHAWPSSERFPWVRGVLTAEREKEVLAAWNNR